MNIVNNFCLQWNFPNLFQTQPIMPLKMSVMSLSRVEFYSNNTRLAELDETFNYPREYVLHFELRNSFSWDEDLRAGE